MCEVDYGRADVFNVDERTARKEYRCVECERKIPIATKYLYVTFLYDGVWTTERAHVECQVLARDAAQLVCGERFWEMGALREHLTEAGVLEGNAHMEIAGEVPAEMRENFKRRWNELLAKYPEVAA